MERGFIQSKLEIKFLLLFILARADGPLDLHVLTDVAMCDSGVGYFDFSTALAELVETGHIICEDGAYTITDKGRKNGAITEDDLPYSVRLRCEQRLAQINEAMRLQRRIKSDLARQEDGQWRVELALEDESGEDVFLLRLEVPLQEDAKRLTDRFHADPKGFLQALRAL